VLKLKLCLAHYLVYWLLRSSENLRILLKWILLKEIYCGAKFRKNLLDPNFSFWKNLLTSQNKMELKRKELSKKISEILIIIKVWTIFFLSNLLYYYIGNFLKEIHSFLIFSKPAKFFQYLNLLISILFWQNLYITRLFCFKRKIDLSLKYLRFLKFIIIIKNN
jgi:hypothetical protein